MALKHCLFPFCILTECKTSMWCYKFPVTTWVKIFCLRSSNSNLYNFFPSVRLFGNLNWSFFIFLFLFWKGENRISHPHGWPLHFHLWWEHPSGWIEIWTFLPCQCLVNWKTDQLVVWITLLTALAIPSGDLWNWIFPLWGKYIVSVNQLYMV